MRRNLLIASIFFLVPLTAAQTGITLYDGSDLNANGNNIINLGNLNSNASNLTINASYVNFRNNTLSNISRIENYFDQGACKSGSVVQTIYPNGSYKCEDVDSISGVEGLPATLAENNTANQSIRFGGSTAIKIGNGSMNTGNARDIVIGKSASIVSPGTDEAIAIGFNADGSNGSVAIGDNSETADNDATAVGPGAFAKGDATVALGYSSETDANNAVSLGRNTFAGGSGGSQIALGYNANSSGDTAISQGYNSSVTANNSLAIGRNTNVTSYDSVALGRDAAVKMQDSIAIGEDSLVQSGSYDSIAIGEGAEVQDYQAVAIGDSAIARFDGAVAIGEGADAVERSVAIGKQAENNGGYWSVAIGRKTVSNGIQSVAIGDRAWTARDAVAVGREANASGVNSTSIGSLSSASAEGAVSIGNNAVASNRYEATFGNLEGEELDVNVTGNLTVHGTNGLSFEDSNADIEGVDSVNPGGGTVSMGGDIDVGGDVETQKVSLGNGMSMQRMNGNVVISD